LSGHRSPRADVAADALIDDSVKMYGPVTIGARCFVEPYCLLGHPRQEDIDQVFESGASDSLDALYERAANIGTEIGAGAIIRSSSACYDGTVLGECCDVAHGVVIREGCRLGPYTRVLAFTSIRRGATIGRGCHIAGLVSARTRIGDYVSSFGYLVHEYTAGVSGLTEPAPVIHTGATIGRGASVIGGVTVGEFALVAARAVVRADVEPYAIVAGDPARVVGRRSDEDIAQLRERIAAGKWG